MSKQDPEPTTTPFPAQAFMQKPTPFSEQEKERLAALFTSTTNPVSSAETSSSEPVSSASAIERALEELGTTLSRKNSDYKVTSGEFSNFFFASDVAGISAAKVMLTQIGIKLGRLKGLTEDRGKIPNYESIEDTVKDLAGYAVILYAYYLGMNW